MRAACEFEKANAFVQVGLLGLVVFLDLSQEAALLGPPLLPVVELGADPAVELVDLHRGESAL